MYKHPPKLELSIEEGTGRVCCLLEQPQETYLLTSVEANTHPPAAGVEDWLWSPNRHQAIALTDFPLEADEEASLEEGTCHAAFGLGCMEPSGLVSMGKAKAATELTCLLSSCACLPEEHAKLHPSRQLSLP